MLSDGGGRRRDGKRVKGGRRGGRRRRRCVAHQPEQVHALARRGDGHRRGYRLTGDAVEPRGDGRLGLRRFEPKFLRRAPRAVQRPRLRPRRERNRHSLAPVADAALGDVFDDTRSLVPFLPLTVAYLGRQRLRDSLGSKAPARPGERVHGLLRGCEFHATLGAQRVHLPLLLAAHERERRVRPGRDGG